MKKIICFVASLALVLTACSKPHERVNTSENSGYDANYSFSESSGQDITSSESKYKIPEENDPPVILLDKEKEFWKGYSDTYSVLEQGWANNEYYFIILKHKETEQTKLVFYDVEKEKVIDFGNIEIGFEKDSSLRNYFFSKEDAFYIMINHSQFLKICFENLELSYVDANIWSSWGNKNTIKNIFISPLGMVAELADEFTIYLYDILSRDNMTVIDVSEIAKEGIVLNQGVSWSFTGEYFEIFINELRYKHADDRISDDVCYAVFSSSGEFLRYVYGNFGTWDYDSIWLYHCDEEDKFPLSHNKWSVYSLSNPEKEPVEIQLSDFVDGGDFPIYSMHHIREYRGPDATRTRILKIDISNGTVETVAVFDGNIFFRSEPSYDGKYFAEYNYDYKSGEFFLYFLETLH